MSTSSSSTTTTTAYKTQIQQIIECLKSDKTRKAALEILLSLSESPDLVDIFIETDLPKLMLRLLESDDIPENELILQILINLSATNEKYINAFLSINTCHRVIRLLFNLIDSSLHKGESKLFNDPNDIMISNDLLLDKNGNTFDMKLELDKYVINSSSITNAHPDIKHETLINLYFMFIANVTSYEQGQNKLIDVDNEKICGIVYFKILDKYFEYIYHTCFDFCSSLIANVSSIKRGRELLLENKIFKVFLIQFDKMNNMKVVNTLRLIRNCCFEYEKHHDELLVRDAVMFNYLIKILLMVNKSKKSGLDDVDVIYFTNFDHDKLSEDDKEVINDLIVDIFLIMTNHNEGVEFMKKKGVDKAIEVIEESCKIGEEKYKDRLSVIKNYLQN